MFGMALRAYLRKIQRLRESSTYRGRSLWEAVFGFVCERSMVTRQEVLERFYRDESALVRGVLHDLAESGIVFSSGSGSETIYRAVSEDELRYMRRARADNGADELLWAVIYREGPITRDQMLTRGGVRSEELDASLQRLLDSGRIQRDDDQRFSAREFFVGLDAESAGKARSSTTITRW